MKCSFALSRKMLDLLFVIDYLFGQGFSQFVKVVDFSLLIVKEKQRIHNWKTKYISFAGQRQLIISVLQSIQLYWMSIFVFPTSVIHELESLFRDFFWT